MKNNIARIQRLLTPRNELHFSGIMKLSAAFLFSFSMAAYADTKASVTTGTAIVETTQQKKVKITGTVTDPTGLPIIGANVMVKGQSTNGTITNLDGHFTLEAPSNSTLVVSYIGYKSQEIKALAGKPLNIKLHEDSEVLDEVVVTALGIKREEKALGYSVQKVSGDQLSKVKAVDIASGLNGKIAGLKIENSSEFNEAPTLVLRGQSPLIVIDGVPYRNISLRDVASDDIESIDVLKGATASALYGARGGSGAVMITTKRGKQEGLQVTVNSSTMFNAGYLKLPEVQKSYSSGLNGKYNDKASYVWGARLDNGTKVMQYNPATYEREMTELTSRGRDNLKNFQELGFITNNNISIAQKGKYGSIRTSLTHIYNKGQFPNEKLNKITYTVSGDMKYKKFSSEAGITYNKRFYPNMGGNAYSGSGYLYNLLVWSGSEYDIRDYKNYWRVKNERANWWDTGNWYDNPYYIANEVTNSDNYDVVNAFLNASYDIMPWLKLSLRSGADMYTEKYERKAPVGSVSGPGKQKGYYSVSQSRGFSTNNDLMLSANHKFGDFSVDGFVGGNIYYYQSDNLASNTAGGLIIPGYYSLKASVDPAETSKSYSSKQTNSIYGKVGLAYKSAVFVEASGRNDWSSTLPEATRSYFYPAVSGSVVVSEFIKMPKVIDFWKVRGSWTTTKTDMGVYAINDVYSISTDVWDNMSAAYSPTTIRNSLLFPSERRSYEIGTALNLFGNRLRLDYTYYNTLTFNNTRNAGLSPTCGYSSTQVNMGEEQMRKGMELTIAGDIIKNRDLTWSATFNWSRDRYYYDKIDPVYSTQKPWVAEGKRWDWIEFKDYQRDPEGNIVHDSNGLPLVNSFKSLKGYSEPDWIWGLSTSLDWKGLTVSVTFDGCVGGIGYSMTDQGMWNAGSHIDSDNEYRYEEVVNNRKTFIGKGVKVVSGKAEWDSDGNIIKDTRVFAPNDKVVSYQEYMMNANPYAAGENKRDQNFLDKTYIKLRDLSISYRLPQMISQKAGMKGVTIGFVGQNLWIWAKEFRFTDPDKVSDVLSSPSMRYLGFNVKLDF